MKENSHIKIHSEKLLLKIFHWVDSINNDHYIDVGFLCGSGSKGSACNSGDQGLTPGSGRSPRESNGNPLQYFSLENSLDRGTWQAIVHGV